MKLNFKVVFQNEKRPSFTKRGSFQRRLLKPAPDTLCHYVIYKHCKVSDGGKFTSLAPPDTVAPVYEKKNKLCHFIALLHC